MIDAWSAKEWEELYYVPLKPALYEPTTAEEVVALQHHLTLEQQQKLANVLRKYSKLFDGTLRVYPHKKVHLEIDPDAKPIHAKAYSVPKCNEKVFKEELEHLCNIGVLRRIGATEWASPTMAIPKKDGRIRVVSDFRELNKVIKRRVYPLPNIDELLRKNGQYNFLTKLDISMEHYTFELDEESQELCAIVTPFGKYAYQRLPMGIKCSPDIAQEIIEDLTRDLEATEAFLDDIALFGTDTFEHHLQQIDLILKRLEDNNFAINPLKCEWCVQETDWLGHWLTPTGIKPWKKKVEAILKLEAPTGTNVSQLRSFLGAVTTRTTCTIKCTQIELPFSPH